MDSKLIETYIDKYLNKQEIMYRVAPKLHIETFWAELLKARKQFMVETPLKDKHNNNFWFAFLPSIASNIDYIDDVGKHQLFDMVSGDLAKNVVFDALVDEAFYSSVIEGALSTKQRTSDMITKNSKPINKSEQMILNNYHALQFVLENLDKPLTEDIILSIYKIVTKDTLEDGNIVEKYRTATVYVWDSTLNQSIYEGPHFSKLQQMMDDLIGFINNDADGLHPVVKASILHLYFVYIHPFFDGNGRTARAVSYMYLLQTGYSFFKFFSISSIIREQKSKYYKAIKDTEDYESDLTYFINYYTDMIIGSIKNVIDRVHRQLSRKLLKNCLEEVGIILSKRQTKFINNLTGAAKNFTTLDEYRKKFKVAYETARTDLNQLTDIGLLTKTKMGKKYVYKLTKIEEFYSLIKTQLR